MKKLIITMSIVLISLLGYSQATNVGELRIADATTAFGTNLPIGTKIYNIATGEYWVATAGVVSTATLTTASASFTQLNPDEIAQNLSYDASNHEIDISAGGTSAVIPIATAASDGLATATQITAIGTNTSNISSNDTDIASNVADIATNASDISTNTSDIASNDSDIATNVSNIATNASDITALESLTAKTDNFEVAADGSSGTEYTLTETADVQYSIQVSINGAISTNFTFGTNKVTLNIPVYKYDLIVVTYTYSA